MDAATILAFLTGVGGLIAAIATALTSARKSQIETLQTILNEIQEENGRLRQRVNELEAELKTTKAELKSTRAELAELLQENAELRAILRKAGIEIPMRMSRNGKRVD